MFRIKKLSLVLIFLVSSCSKVLSEAEIENRFKHAGSLFGTALGCENDEQAENSIAALMKFEQKHKLSKIYSKEKIDYFHAVYWRLADEMFNNLKDIEAKTGGKHQVCSNDDFISNTVDDLYICISIYL